MRDRLTRPELLEWQQPADDPADSVKAMIFEVLAIGVIVILGVAPFLISIWGLHYITHHSRHYIEQVRAGQIQSTGYSLGRSLSGLAWVDSSLYVGDTSCQFNARSPFLRCAVNPEGPCQGCSCYESRSYLNPAVKSQG